MNTKSINDQGELSERDKGVILNTTTGGIIGGLTVKIGASVGKLLGSESLLAGTTAFKGASIGAMTGALGGGLAVASVGALVENKAKTPVGKSIGLGLSGVGGVTTVLSGIALLGLESVLGVLFAGLGFSLGYLFLYFLLTGKLNKAKEISKDKLGEDKTEEIIGKIQEKITKDGDKTTKDGDKTTIRV